MARHRTRLTPQDRRRAVVRWVGRVALWLALGAVVGLAALGALTWAGSPPAIRLWVAVAAGVLAAVAAGAAGTVQGPAASDETDERGGPTDGPSPS